DERVAELSHEKEDREREGVVAVPELAREEREAGRDHERAETVLRPSRPREEAGREERPGGHDGRERSQRRREEEVVDLYLVREDPDHDTGDRQERESDSHS